MAEQTTDDRRRRTPPWLRGDVAVLLGLALAASGFFAPYFRHWHRVNPRDDWLQHAARHAAVRISLRDHGQLPLRTHLFGGGYPTLWNPEDPTLSPFILATLVCGEIAGLKVVGFALYLVGVVGVYLMARGVYGQSRAGAAAAACVLAFSSWTPTRLYKGNLNELYFLCFPLMVWLLARSPGRLSFVVLALLAAGLAMDGKLTWFSMMFFLALAAARLCGRQGAKLDLSPLVRMGALALVVALLAAPKLLPVMDMLSAQGGLGRAAIARHFDYYAPETIEAFSAGDVWQVFTRPVVGLDYAPSPDNVGLPVALAACAGLVLGGWKLWRDCAIAALALLLVMAHHAPLDVFRAFTTLPGFNTFSVPAKYFDFYLVLFIALMVGSLADRGLSWCRGRPSVLAVAGLLLVGVLSFEWLQNQPLLANLFTAELPDLRDRAEPFHQVRGIGMKTTGQRTLHSNNYYNLLRGVGIIDQFTAIPIPAYAEPKFFVDPEDRLHPNPQYRGEAYLLRDNHRVEVDMTPNRIRLECALAEPDTVVINQNFDRYWRSDRGEVRDRDGLLTLALPAGRHEVTLSYVPTLLYWGIVFLAVGLAALAVVTVLLPRWRIGVDLSRRRSRVWLGVGAVAASGVVLWWVVGVVTPTLRRDAWLYDGLCAQRRGAHKAAIASFDRVLAERPRHAAALRACAHSHSRMGQYDTAIALLRRALDVKPGSVRVVRSLAEAFVARHEVGRAIAVLQKGLRVRPFAERLHLRLAKCYAIVNQPGLALAALERAIDLGAGRAEAVASAPAFEALSKSSSFQRLLGAKRKAGLLY